MNSPTSIFRYVFFALAGSLLAAYGVSYQISVHPGAEYFRRLLDSMPILKSLFSFPPALFITFVGVMILIIAVYRLRAAWLAHQIASRRRMVSVPAVNERDEQNARRYPGSAHDPADADWESEEFGPDPAYGPSQYDRYRGNGQYDPRRQEAYR